MRLLTANVGEMSVIMSVIMSVLMYSALYIFSAILLHEI